MLKKTVITVGLGFMGGWFATLFSLPLAWMLGSLGFVVPQCAGNAGLYGTNVDRRVLDF